MKKTKKKEHKMEYIEWCDAATINGWQTAEEIMDWVKSYNWVVRSVGWVIDENSEHVMMVLSKKDDDEYTDAQYLLVQKIPKPWIKKRVQLYEKKK